MAASVMFAAVPEFLHRRYGFSGEMAETMPTMPMRAESCRLRAHREDLIGMEGEELNLLDRLTAAWEIIFSSTQSRQRRRIRASNAEIAKQRLKMILISDRCSVSVEAKKKMVDNIVGALKDFLEIESQDNVELKVCADPELGTVYSVTVPVRRVKPQYQDFSIIPSDDVDE